MRLGAYNIGFRCLFVSPLVLLVFIRGMLMSDRPESYWYYSRNRVLCMWAQQATLGPTLKLMLHIAKRRTQQLHETLSLHLYGISCTI